MDNCIHREVKKISYFKSHFRKDYDDLYHLDILKIGPFLLSASMGIVDIGYKKSPIIANDEEGWLQKVKQFIEEELVQQKDKAAIVKKYIWMAKYFNSFIKKAKHLNITPIKS